ncbi:hypothetical protein MVEN_00827400 [Mycena venus]|uniref:DUF7918 domain-containing protein n=1 Tax=Mycena venus TaxID=2733690 RepID=A0A8H6YGG5_9AGAR|nr:hypothetical protein MVEN_00827400 [Mycena venus]
MLHWNEFRAWVNIDGIAAPEYGVEVLEKENTVVCWIPSELGKKFSICWRNSSFPHDVGGYVQVDGTACGGHICYHQRDLNDTFEKSGVTSGATLKPFVFSSIELTEDDTFLGYSSLQDLGRIELTLKRVKVFRTNVAPVVYSLSNRTINERSKKAVVTQQITLAKPERLDQPVRCVSVQPVGPDIVKFCFKYRPIDVLRANEVVLPLSKFKRKASAEPHHTRTPDEDLADAEEEKVLRDKLNDIQQKLRALEEKRLKKKIQPRIKSEEDCVVRPRLERKKKKIKLEPTEIDLT